MRVKKRKRQGNCQRKFCVLNMFRIVLPFSMAHHELCCIFAPLTATLPEINISI